MGFSKMKVLLLVCAAIFAVYAADEPAEEKPFIHHIVNAIRNHHINVMKHNYDIARNRANGARNNYNRARNNVNHLRAQYIRYQNQQRTEAHNYQNWGRQDNRAGGVALRAHNRRIQAQQRCKKNRKQWINQEHNERVNQHATYRMYIKARNLARQYKAEYQMYKRHAAHYTTQMRNIQNQIQKLMNRKNALQRLQRRSQNQMRNFSRNSRRQDWQTRKALKRTNRFKRAHQAAINRLHNGIRACNNNIRNFVNAENKARQRQRQLHAKYMHFRRRSAHFQHLFERTHQAWQRAQRGLGHLRSVANSATHNERQWLIRYSHARG